jgi:hypothetical protein
VTLHYADVTRQWSLSLTCSVVCASLFANVLCCAVLCCVLQTGASYGHVLGALGGDLSLAPQLLQTMTDEGTAPDLQVYTYYCIPLLFELLLNSSAGSIASCRASYTHTV